MTKVSLSIIALNAAEKIGACLASIKDYVDEVCILDTGSTDETLTVVRTVCPNARVETYIDPDRHPVKGWTSDFSNLRNRAFAMCGHEAILWLDADDTVEDPRRLRALINDVFSGKPMGVPADAISLRYEYAFDRAGHCTVAHPRHRVLRKDCFAWHDPVHEDIHPLKPTKLVEFSEDTTCYIRHARADAASPEAAERNLWIMEQYKKRGGILNDRLHQNIATSMLLLHRYQEAIVEFDLAIAVPHSNPESDYITHLRCADAYLKLGKSSEAKLALAKAQMLFPDRKTPYLVLSEILVDQGLASEALSYVAIAESVSGDKKSFAWNPTVDNFVPRMVKAKAYTLLEDYEKALAEYEALSPHFPKEEQVIKPRDLLRRILGNRALSESFRQVYDSLEPFPADQALLLGIAPLTIRTYPWIARRLVPSLPTDKKTMVIFCGPTVQTWGQGSLEAGIGGSEEAVILLSQEMAALGWHVEVYGYPSPTQMGPDEYGVHWHPFYAYDPTRPVDVYVGWRQVTNLPEAKAGCKALWLHDTVIPEYFTQEMVDSWDVIFALSESHAAALPACARAKLVMTANGLSPAYFADGKNKPHSFIYASSPDRGLEALLHQWPTIKAALPDASLDLYYGFTPYYAASAAKAPELRRLQENVGQLCKQPGVFMHGMIGQRELAHAFARCGFWLYPTAWSETSCITGMKAQAMGAIPITSRYPDSAIPETCKFDLGPPARSGSIYDDADWLAEWTATVIREADRDHAELRKAMKTWARQEFSWSKVAAQWSALFSERLASSSPSRRAPALSSTS